AMGNANSHSASHDGASADLAAMHRAIALFLECPALATTYDAAIVRRFAKAPATLTAVYHHVRAEISLANIETFGDADGEAVTATVGQWAEGCGAAIAEHWRSIRAACSPSARKASDLEAELRRIVGGGRSKLNGAANRDDDVVEPQAVVTRLDAVEPEPVKWLWLGRIARGKLTVFSGDPGLGKSFLTLDIAARVTTGAPWPDGGSLRSPGSVVLLSAEDDLADTVRPRLDAAGANVSKIVAIQGIRAVDSRGAYDRMVDLSRDLERLNAEVLKCGDCKLVVIDPISAYLGNVKSHDNGEVRGLLAPLAAMAAKLGVSVIAVNHLRKGDGPAIYRSMGSIGFVAAARAAYAITKDKDDETGKRRLWLPLKNNIGNDQFGMAFCLTTEGSPNGHPRIVWEADPVGTKADDALAPVERRRPGPKPEEREKAVKFLRQVLAPGPRLSKEVIDEATNGYGIAKHTLDRARDEAGVESFRQDPKDPKSPWWLRLRKSDGAKPANGSGTWQCGNVEEHSADSPGIEAEKTPDCQNAKMPESNGEWGDV
ncbi:MAG: AAA family ATPase, partial [Pirellulales bacterium]